MPFLNPGTAFPKLGIVFPNLGIVFQKTIIITIIIVIINIFANYSIYLKGRGNSTVLILNKNIFCQIDQNSRLPFFSRIL